GRKWLIADAVIVLLATIGGWLIMSRGANNNTATALPGWTTETATTGTIGATVNATGNVEAKAQADLRFASDGTVTEILVKPGDQVQTGQPLARLDGTDLQLKVEQSQADLQQAQADLQKLMDQATPEELAAAKARVAQAQGQ